MYDKQDGGRNRRGNAMADDGLNVEDLDDGRDMETKRTAQKFHQMDHPKDISNSQLVDNFTSQTDDKKYKKKAAYGSADEKKNANKIRVLFLGDGKYISLILLFLHMLFSSSPLCFFIFIQRASARPRSS